MKYKKLLILITCLLFITVAVFCFVSAFRVTDVELYAQTVDNSNENVMSKCEGKLKKYEGKNLIFISTDEIESELINLSGYIDVLSVEKNFPNKLTVKIKEKSEAFTIKNGNEYYSLDKDFCVLSKKTDVKNNVDGKSNVILDISVADYNTALKVGEKIKLYDSETENYLSLASSLICANRKDISKVLVTVKKDGVEYKTLTLTMKEGVSFKILKANEETILKINKTLEFYSTLSNKGYGEYVAVLENSGNVTVKQ